MMPNDYREAAYAAQELQSLEQHTRWLLAVLNEPVSPRATVLCTRPIMEGGRAVICGAPLAHSDLGNGATLTTCPRCDRYEVRDDA